MRQLCNLQKYWRLLLGLWRQFLHEGINLEQEQLHCCEQFATQFIIALQVVNEMAPLFLVII